MGSDEPPGTIARFVDRQGRDVFLTEGRWNHITVGHPELTGDAADVRATVEGAEVTRRDVDCPGRENHYRKLRDRLYLKVCAGYDARGVGVAITAHPTPHLKRGEQHLWP